jgi:hypothetical protein
MSDSFPDSSKPSATPAMTEQHKSEIMNLKLEIESLRSQNNMLQQKLLISLSDHHSSRVTESSLTPEPKSEPTPSQQIDSAPTTSSPSYPPEGFIEEGLIVYSDWT